MDNGDRRARFSGATRPPAAVRVGFNIFRKSVVDDVGEVIDIESACGDIGCHEQLEVSQAEFLHHGVALLLREVAVQRVGIVAVFYQRVGNLLRFAACAAEYDAVDIGIVVGNAFEGEVFVFGVGEVVDVLHVCRPFVFAADDDFARRVHIVFGDAFYLRRHGCREKQHLPLGGHLFQNFIDTVGEAHVEHLVGFVHNDGADVVEMHHAPMNQVDKSARRGDDDMHAVAERANLALDARPAVYGEHPQSVDISRIIVEVAGNLQAQFARRAENERLWCGDGEVGFLYDGQSECRRLACSRLGESYDVGVFIQQQGDNLFLYRHGGFVADFGNGAQYVGTDAQFFK